MQGQRETDSIQDERDKKSPTARLMIAGGGEKRYIPCDYELVDLVFESEYGASAPEMFNQLTNKRSFDLFLYLGKDFVPVDDQAIPYMINTFWSDDFIGVGALYTDSLVKQDGKFLCTKVNPAYSMNLFDEHAIITTPFMAKAAVLPEFNTKIKELYLWDGILWLMNNTFLAHIPKPLFEVNNGASPIKLSDDIKIIHDTYYPKHNSANSKATQ